MVKAHEGWVTCVRFSPCGERFISSGFDSIIRVWDFKSRENLLELKGHEGWVWCIDYSPDG